MPLFTITSDFGDQNYLTGLVKGKIFGKNVDAQIVDITNNIAPYQINQAAYIFKSIMSHYPANTFHFMLCSLFHTQNEELIVCKHNDSYIFGVDNGIFSLLFEENLPEFYSLKLTPAFKYTIENITESFSLAAHYLAQGMAKIIDIAIPYTLQHKPIIAKPSVRENIVELQVLYIDNFKNVVLNLNRKEFEEYALGRNFRIEFLRNESINVISEKYNDVQEGKKLCLFNAAGYMEIAVYKGQAADLFGFEIGNNIEDIYKTVKIYFD